MGFVLRNPFQIYSCSVKVVSMLGLTSSSLVPVDCVPKKGKHFWSSMSNHEDKMWASQWDWSWLKPFWCRLDCVCLSTTQRILICKELLVYLQMDTFNSLSNILILYSMNSRSQDPRLYICSWEIIIFTNLNSNLVSFQSENKDHNATCSKFLKA
jgi:hypothetical protein